MNFRALRQTFTITVDAEIAGTASQCGNQTGLAANGEGIKFTVFARQTAALILGSAVVCADAFGDFGGSGIAFLLSAHQTGQQRQHKQLGNKVFYIKKELLYICKYQKTVTKT